MVYNLANRIPEKQRLYQAMSKPVYMRPPRSKLYVYSYYGLFTVVTMGTVFQSYQLIRGKPAE
ncbi:hypothetical protein FRC01_002344 [Tulasnella sp. 417]|nr:hypothetical protein FRC01_002344 [Tulasnella sp. 417]